MNHTNNIIIIIIGLPVHVMNEELLGLLYDNAYIHTRARAVRRSLYVPQTGQQLANTIGYNTIFVY